MSRKTIRLEEWAAEQMKDPEFRAAVEELEPAYQVAKLRMEKGLTQEQLAELVGTKQSSIARLESGKAEPRLSFLRRVVEALGGKIEVRIGSPGEERPAEPCAEQVGPVSVAQEPNPAEKVNYPKPSPQETGYSFVYIGDRIPGAETVVRQH